MKTYIDNYWYERCLGVRQLLYLSYLEQDSKQREKEKQSFLDGITPLPSFMYPALVDFDETSYIDSYRALQQEIKRKEENIYIQEAYTDVLEELIQQVFLLTAVKECNDQLFCDISIAQFGDAQLEHVALLLPSIDTLIAKGKESSDIQMHESAVYIENILAVFTRTTYNDIPILHQDTSPVKTSTEIEEHIKAAFMAYEIFDWNTYIDPTSSNRYVYINHTEKLVVIPKERTITEAHLKALVRHEVGVHIKRRTEAEKSKFRLLTRGLARYIKGEEGLSKYEELQVYPQAFRPTLEIYLGIALIRGLDGKQRNFREMFNFFVHYFTLYSQWEPQINIEDMAYNRTEKLFRGTSGQSTGVCFTKDLVYFDGYLAIKDILKHDKKEAERMYAGKYDPSNQSHRRILDGLHIG